MFISPQLVRIFGGIKSDTCSRNCLLNLHFTQGLKTYGIFLTDNELNSVMRQFDRCATFTHAHVPHGQISLN